MTPRVRQGLQEDLLDRVKRDHPGTTDSEIASVAGCDRSLVSRWRNGEREIGLTELVRLQRRYSAVTILSPIAAMDGSEVRAIAPDPCPLRRGSLSLVQAASSLASEVETALEDGQVDREEATRLQALAQELAQRLGRFCAGVRVGRVN